MSTSKSDTSENILDAVMKEEEDIEDATTSGEDKLQKRLLMKDWLTKMMDEKKISDVLSWLNKKEGLFKIKWLHKATDSWEVQADGVLFKEWCKHTGRYDPNSENPRKWKANFRCALNSLPDVVLVPNLCVRKGKDAYRVFRILPEKNPEKVKEKQDASRKRRIVQKHLKQKEQLNQPPLGKKMMITRADTTRKLSVKKAHTSESVKAGADGCSKQKTSTSFNGMEALITAAALMAEKPAEKSNSGTAIKSSITTSISVNSSSVASPQKVSNAGLATATAPIASSTTLAASTSSPLTGLQLPPGAVPLIRSAASVTPLRGVYSTSANAGNILLNLRLANSTTAAKVLQPAQCLTIPQLSQMPGLQSVVPHLVQQNVCLQPVMSSQGLQALPAYLIPKSMVQKSSNLLSVKSASSYLSTTLTAASNTVSISKQSMGDKISNSYPSQVTTLKKIKTDKSDYARLKSDVEQLDLSKVRFSVCKFASGISIVRIYDSCKPSVELAVTVSTDFTYQVIVHNKQISHEHILYTGMPKLILSAADVLMLLNRLAEYVVCIGNPEDICHQQYSDYTAYCSAYQEPDMGAKNNVIRYFSTIRSKSCDLLIKDPGDTNQFTGETARKEYRCFQCTKIRDQVLSMKGLFTLIDMSKSEDSEAVRAKRVKTLKASTSKDLLAAKVDELIHKLELAKKLIPLGLPSSSSTQMKLGNVVVTSSNDHINFEQPKEDTPEPETKELNQSGDSTKNSEDIISPDVGKLISLETGDACIQMDSDSMPSTEKLLEELTSSPLTGT